MSHASGGQSSCQDAVSKRYSVDICPYGNELLLRLLTRPRWVGPWTLIFGFYVLVTVPLFLISALTPPPFPPEEQEFITFLDNISWSLSMAFLFPPIVGLTLLYYRKIPAIFEYLINELLESGNDAELRGFLSWMRTRFHERFTPIAFLIVTLVLNVIYFRQILGSANPKADWMNSGHLLQSWFGAPRGLTWAGLYAAIVQIVLIY
ncbi:MAG: hypothetical protein JSV91_04990, partial [Phycisphaerales bacterium]